MPGPALTITSVLTCPHGGPVTIAPGNARVTILGQPVATMANMFTVAGCPFQVPIGTGTKPQPCVRIQYTAPATRVMAMGQPLILATSAGLCQSAEQIPQGAPIPVTIQPRVIAT